MHTMRTTRQKIASLIRASVSRVVGTCLGIPASSVQQCVPLVDDGRNNRSSYTHFDLLGFIVHAPRSSQMSYMCIAGHILVVVPFHPISIADPANSEVLMLVGVPRQFGTLPTQYIPVRKQNR